MAGNKRRGRKARKGRAGTDQFGGRDGPYGGLFRGGGPGVKTGWPRVRDVDLNYVSYVAITNTSGVLSKYQWRLNSLYDPDYTSTGHQPLGYDQWTPFYNHYVVTSCDWEAIVGPNDGSRWQVYGSYVSDDATVPSTIEELVENGSSVVTNSRYGGGHDPVMRGSVDMSQFFGVRDLTANTAVQADVGNNPTEQALLTIWAQPVNGSDTVTNTVIIKLCYHARFMEPKDLSQS